MKHIQILLSGLILLLTACGTGRQSGSLAQGDTLSLHYAENLTLVKYAHYTKAILRNPWDTAAVLQTYLLVPQGEEPDSLPEGVVLHVPMDNALVYSSVHGSLLCELGASRQIGGVCDAEYIYSPELKERLAKGTLADCGNSMSPNFERIIQLRPQGIFLSPYENNTGYGKLDKLNIPIVLCADYMETSPLGRAEWMKFYGMLFGQEDKAHAMFEQIATEYEALKAKVQACDTHPKILSDTRYGQVWYMPGESSTMGIMYRDAGGENPFSYLKQSGSAPLSAEQVLEKAHDADIWLMKYNQENDKTLTQLAAEDAIYTRFKPFKEGKVYGCNTRTSYYYEITPYHPDRLLSDLILIFHPELNVKQEAEFFKLMK